MLKGVVFFGPMVLVRDENSMSVDFAALFERFLFTDSVSYG